MWMANSRILLFWTLGHKVSRPYGLLEKLRAL